MKIVTSGAAYLDIDGYAGCIAFAELLNQQGAEAKAVSTALLNESITPTVRLWKTDFTTEYVPSLVDTFTVIDVSAPDSFDPIVDLSRVERIIDHHVGFEEYWQQRIGKASAIEFVGAACTQVYEHWVTAGLAESMSASSAGLLMAGILDNTLNFKANVSTPRDRAAYNHLATIAKLPSDWPALYFSECQATIEARLDEAIVNDCKLFSSEELVKYQHHVPGKIGQLVVWNAKKLVGKRQEDIEKEMSRGTASEWLINVVSIEEGISYFLATSPAVQAKMQKLLGLSPFQNNLAVADRLWLRKEILKAAFNAH